MRLLNKKFLFLLVVIVSFLIVQTAMAAWSDKFFDNLGQTAGPGGANYSGSQASENFINTKIGQIVGGIVGLIGIIFLGLTVYSGIQWMTAGGNEETVNKSKKRVINGTIGVGLTLCAFILANLYFSFFEQKFMNPGAPTSINTPPNGYQNIVCQTDPQCADRTGPTTGQPMTCYITTPPNGICGECGSNDDCMVGTVPYECDPPTHLCIPAQSLTCDQLTPMGPDQCLFDPDCKWVPNPNQEEWNVGSCVDNSESPCPQCDQDRPFCCSNSTYCASGVYLNTCVECISEDGGYNNCESYGTGLNFCDGTTHTCDF